MEAPTYVYELCRKPVSSIRLSFIYFLEHLVAVNIFYVAAPNKTHCQQK